MTTQCEQIDKLLLEGNLEEAARHAAGCEACRETLAVWNDIGETARGLRADWQSDMLLPRIKRELADEKRAHLTSTLWRVAAVLVLTAGIGGGSWYGVHAHQRAEFDRTILRVSALDQVERAERAHVDAIEQLEKVAEPKLESTGSPLMVSYKEKLMVLDDAIAECQTNIDRNRQNAHLRKQLLAIYNEKQKTLQDVLREGDHVSNE
ncbi:MAG TPA: hypothetical protein VLV78_06110 [Thermoanaerobaculia bacterium]|nr:hypothetical protein [Thermoanaerobaculia bacterium]